MTFHAYQPLLAAAGMDSVSLWVVFAQLLEAADAWAPRGQPS